MNPIKKAYCRIFQTCFKVAIPFLPYRKPKIMKKVDEIVDLCNKKDINSVLLVTDKSIRQFGITKHLEEVLEEAGIKCAVYDQVVANPTNVNVEEAAAMYRENDCEAIIGFGGGSSMDCAKGTGVMIARPKTPLSKLEGILKVHARLPLLIAIPTTAGTGSETTLAAVITDAETRHKYTIDDFGLIPKYAVLDPEVTRTLPPFITATTGIDALTHSVESFVGNSTTRATRKDALKSTRLIFRYLEKAVNDGNDMKARANMLYASYLGGAAFTVSYVGYCHAVAHSLGGEYNTPHGLANAVIIPYVLEDYGPCVYGKLKKLAIAAGLAKKTDSKEKAAKAFIQGIRDLNERIGIPNKIDGIQEKDIEKLAKYADKEGNPLYPVPKLMDAVELQKFYYLVMKKNED